MKGQLPANVEQEKGDRELTSPSDSLLPSAQCAGRLSALAAQDHHKPEAVPATTFLNNDLLLQRILCKTELLGPLQFVSFDGF